MRRRTSPSRSRPRAGTGPVRQAPAPARGAVTSAAAELVLDGGPTRPEHLLSLQAEVGNRALQRTLAAAPRAGRIQRGLWDWLTGGGKTTAPDERAKAEQELEEFRKKTFPCLTKHRPSSGLGQFDVCFDPKAGSLTVTLKVSFNFVDGDPSKVSPGFKPEEFKWTPGEQATFKADYLREVGALWSGKHLFKSTKKYWERMTVKTSVVVSDVAADQAHFQMTVGKYPSDAGMVQSSICPPGYHHDGNACRRNAAAADGTRPDYGTAALDINDLRREQKLDWSTGAVTSIPFRPGKAVLDGTGTTALGPLVASLKANAAMRVELTGYTSSTHRAGETPAQGAASNMALARARTAAVQAHLTGQGIAAERILVRNRGEDGAGPGNEWCMVSAQTGTQETQHPGVHETGHMLGLEDEYTTTGTPAGQALPAKADQMIKGTTGHDVKTGDTQSAMSLGSTVQPWHYSSFLEALRKISGMAEWGL